LKKKKKKKTTERTHRFNILKYIVTPYREELSLFFTGTRPKNIRARLLSDGIGSRINSENVRTIFAAAMGPTVTEKRLKTKLKLKKRKKKHRKNVYYEYVPGAPRTVLKTKRAKRDTASLEQYLYVKQ